MISYRLLSLVLPGLIGALVALLFLKQPFLHGLELRATDLLFVARYQFQGPQPVDPRIVIVGLDEASYKLIGKPFAFWEPEFAKISQGLLQAGASAVALDFTPNVQTGQLPEAVQSLVMAGRIELMQALTTGQVLLGDLPDDTHHWGAHADKMLMETAQQFGNLAMLTVIADGDGVHREIPLYAPQTDGGRILSLAARSAELATGNSTLEVSAGQATLGGRSVPLEGNPLQPSLRVNYPGPHDSFRRIPMSTLITSLKAGRPLPDVKGCLCLVAPWSSDSQDFRAAPFNLLPDHDTFGIEIHAAALNTLLTGNGLRAAPATLWYLLCVAGSYFLFFTASSMRFKRSVIYGLLSIAGYSLVALYAFCNNYWLPLCAPVVAWLVAYLAGFMGRYYTVELKRRSTRDMFRRMVAPEVVEHVLDNPEALKPGGSHRRVTVLYTDINDFTPMCEGSQPSEVIEMLNRYFEAMVDIIQANKGMLKQFVGDEIMCIYGAPASYGDDAARAVNTALEMLEKLKEMEQKDPTGRGFYDIKVGIHTGDVVVGHVGSIDHLEYAAVGDDVNLGARIMATTKKLDNVKVLVSDVTRREAAPLLPHVEWISHGVQSFKGKTAQMEVFEIRRRQAANKEKT